jgi:hypothetical protein
MIRHMRPSRPDVPLHAPRAAPLPPCAPRLAQLRVVGRSYPRPHPPRSSRKGRQEGEGCTIAVPHQVGHDHWRHCVFKCFRRFQTCCKLMFQVFQLFQTYVLSVSFGCCMCFYGYTRMFQAYVSDVFQTYVASVSSGCSKSRS